MKIPLPETLPERFTVEFAINTTHGNSSIWLTSGPAFYGRDKSCKGSSAVVRSTHAGIQAVGETGPEAVTLYEADQHPLPLIEMPNYDWFVAIWAASGRCPCP